MALTKITANIIEDGAISTASLADTSITADKLHTTLDLTGKTITVATATAGDNDTTVASTAFVSTAIANLADSAPATLDTLNELAAALGDDANFSTTVTNSIALKAPLASPDFTGDVTFDTSTLVVDSTNNRVGIGTDNPGQLLHVQDTNNSAFVQVGNDNGSVLYGVNTAGNAFVSGQTSSKDLIFEVNNGNNMRLHNSGKLGIGTDNTTPTGKLTIAYPSGNNAPNTITAASTYLQLGSTDYGPNNDGKFMIGFGYTNGTANTNSPAYIGFEEATTSGDTYGDLTFYTRSVYSDTAPTERMRITGGGVVKIWHGATTYYTSFEEANEINTYTAAGASSTMYLNHNGGDVNLRNGALEVKDNGDITIGNTTISPASGFSDQRGFGYDNSTGFTEIAATSAGAPLEIGTNNASGSAILSLRKQGTVVGGISTFDGEVHFGRNTAGIMPIGSGTAPRVVPTSFSSGTLADGTVTLGSGNARWKDFYMAGDMNVGSQTSDIVPSNRKAWFQGGGSYFTSYSAGQSTITSDASGLIVGPSSTRSGNANQYTAGISFDHLLNYSTTGNVTYNTYPHAWIGLKTYDFPGYERSSLVLATRNGFDSTSQTNDQLVISPHGEITMPNQPSARFYCSSGPSVTSETVINSANTGATEHFDRNGDYNASTGEFTVPVSGIYLAYAYSNFSGSTAIGYLLLQYYNGSSWVNYAISYKSDTDGWNSVNISTTIEASAGIKLRFVYYGDPDAGFHWFYGGWHLLA
jgi:hypothetical protein